MGRHTGHRRKAKPKQSPRSYLPRRTPPLRSDLLPLSRPPTISCRAIIAAAARARAAARNAASSQPKLASRRRRRCNRALLPASKRAASCAPRAPMRLSNGALLVRLTGGSRTEERRGDTAGRSCRGEGGGMSGAPATERWRKAAARLVRDGARGDGALWRRCGSVQRAGRHDEGCAGLVS